MNTLITMRVFGANVNIQLQKQLSQVIFFYSALVSLKVRKKPINLNLANIFLYKLDELKKLLSIPVLVTRVNPGGGSQKGRSSSYPYKCVRYLVCI